LFVSAQPPADQPPAEQPAAEQAPQQTPEAAPAVPAAQPPAGETEDELKERLEAMREQITKENQRAIDARNEKLETARKRVDELNAGFAEWYYVISEAEYKKLHITLTDLIQPKSAAAPTPAPGGGFPPGFGGLPGQ
jgi:hypothetical protein